MRKKLNITEGIFPMPVLMIATYNEDGSVNVMNAAWGTMMDRDKVALNLTETHKTLKNGGGQKNVTLSRIYGWIGDRSSGIEILKVLICATHFICV